MCKKSLLMMLLMALLVPWAANAQQFYAGETGMSREAYEAQIGEGTSTFGYFPFYTLYNYSIGECLFLASELQEAGVLPGTVTSLSWYATNSPGYEQQGISFWMANVSDEALTTTSHVTTNMTLVYTGSVTPAIGWNEFTFNEGTFTWDGTSNVLIFCQRNNGAWNSTVNWQGGTVDFTATSYRYQDSGAYDVTVTNTMYTSSVRPNIIIKGNGESTGPTCERPANFVVSDITAHGATFTWESNVGDYIFECKKESEEEWRIYATTATTLTLNDLVSNTAYNARVKAVCGPDFESNYRTANFTTLVSCSAPSGLTAANIATNSASLNWTAGNEESDWVLQYGTTNAFTEGTFTEVNVNGQPAYILTDLVDGTTYYARVKADCGGGDESVWTSVINFRTLEICPEGKVCIGEGTSISSYLPTYIYYNYSLTQQIYTVDEIGQAGEITSVDIYSLGTATRNLDVYMVSTEKGSFGSTTDWIPVTEANLVYSGNTTFAANSWNTIELDAPFLYDGRSNIALIVDDNTGSYVSSISYYVFSATSQAIRIYSDPTNYDPENPSSYTGTVLSVKNRVRLAISEPPACPKPTHLAVDNITGHTAEISWTSDANEWQIELNGQIIADATENSYTITGLDPETEYIVRVRANCGDSGYSEWSQELTFTTDVACPAPTNVAVSNITAFTADVSWNSSTEAMLRYAPFDESMMIFQGFVTDPGAMSDGSDASWLKNGQGSFGPSANYASGYMVADDFTVDAATTLSQIEVYGYQTGSTIESTFTGLYVQIYDGNPAENGTVIWGDMETNIMTSTSFTNCYRGSDGTPTGMTRPIMAITATVNVDLEPGTYWLAYSLAGTGTSGPWATPYAEPTVGNTGEGGIQYSPSNSAWQLVSDSGTSENYGIAMKLSFGDLESLNWEYVYDLDNNMYGLSNLDPETQYMVQVRANCGDEGNSEWVTAIFTTLPTCLAPTNLAVSDIEARQAVLTWTETGTATAWEVEVYTAQTGQITTWDVTQNPYTLVGLEPETHYTVSVRAKCSDTDFSDWSEAVTFTTDVACHAPTNLTVTDITTTSATIGWTSDNTTFDVWYREHVIPSGSLSYDFDNGTLAGWTTIDADEDGYTWVSSADPGDYHNSGVDLTGNGHNESDHFVLSGSYANGLQQALYPDNYLVSPQVNLGGSITFWAQAQDANYAAEHFGVAVSTMSNTDPDAFTTIQEWTMTAKSMRSMTVADNADKPKVRGGNRDTGAWYEFTVDLGEYSGTGYVAIRHFDCTDMFILNVDDIYIVQPGDNVVVPDWIEANEVENPYALTGLAPATTYDVQVRSNCGGDDGVSTWLTGSFTTLSDCIAPWDVEVANVTATTADLSWNGYKASYDVAYYQINTIYTADFEDGLIPAEMVNDTVYPWIIVTDTIVVTDTITNITDTIVKNYMMSGNGGVASSTSAISMTVTYAADGVIEFDAQLMGEGSSWDVCKFICDDEVMFSVGANGENWVQVYMPVAAGEHTFTWSYTKDGSVNAAGDHFAVDNLVMYTYNLVATVEEVTSPYTITGLTPETEYAAVVSGHGCDEWSETVDFTTLEGSTTITQTVELIEGYNWFSVYVDGDPIELLEALQAALDEHGLTIEGPDGINYNLGDGFWWGDLDEIGITSQVMYLIEVDADCTIELEGFPIDPTTVGIDINPGYNWIAFPCAEEVEINTALEGFEAGEEDVIEGPDGMIYYLGDGYWWGDFESFVPGQGYLYFYSGEEPTTLYFQTGAKKARSINLNPALQNIQLKLKK